MKKGSKKMANTKVEFRIKTNQPVDELYLIGNVHALGEWELSKAVKLELCNECGCYTVSKMLPAGQTDEFKVLAKKDWNNVEKGYYNEEVLNHTFVAEKGMKVEIEVPNFGY